MNRRFWLRGSAAFCALAGIALAQESDRLLTMVESDHLRNQRYCEILVVSKHGLSAIAATYNTAGLNDCPEAQWKVLDPQKLEAESKTFKIVMNGPRFFTMDRNALKNPGPVRDFDGLEARLVAQLQVSSPSSKRKSYVEMVVDRESQYVYEAGKRVYELLSPDGKTYIMQSYSLEVDPTLNEAALGALASRLTLPNGWCYVVHYLTEELTVRTSGSRAHILQDDLRNTYQRID